MSGLPRRKVVSSYQQSIGINWFRCTLSCGHSVSANGMKRGGLMPTAPLTVSCYQCKAALTTTPESN